MKKESSSKIVSKKQVDLMSVIEDYAQATAQKYWQDDQGNGGAVKAAHATYNIAAHNLRKFLLKERNTKSFAIGDTVKAKPGKKLTPILREPRIVTAVRIEQDGSMYYAIDGSSWYSHELLVLESRATKTSLSYVARMEIEEEFPLNAKRK